MKKREETGAASLVIISNSLSFLSRSKFSYLYTYIDDIVIILFDTFSLTIS